MAIKSYSHEQDHKTQRATGGNKNNLQEIQRPKPQGQKIQRQSIPQTKESQSRSPCQDSSIITGFRSTG